MHCPRDTPAEEFTQMIRDVPRGYAFKQSFLVGDSRHFRWEDGTGNVVEYPILTKKISVSA